MSLASVATRAVVGMNAPEVTCEVHLSGGLPSLTIVGLVETAVRESRERVKAAISQSGFDVPDRRITVNLAPADLPKNGGQFDLAIALGILVASGQLPGEKLERHEFYGELAFSGALRPVKGLLPAFFCAQQHHQRCVVPVDCGADAAMISDGHSLVAGHLIEVARYLRGQGELVPATAAAAVSAGDAIEPSALANDMAEIQGQHLARRALEIAAAGAHNLLMVGPPGTGKTMLARCLPGLMPAMTEQQAIETLLLHSLVPGNGVHDQGDQLRCWRPDNAHYRRPFRSPHHTASAVALVGGGKPPRPGEISLAHNGVLFLDELPEFARNAMEALREPLESGTISIARANQNVVFPARFQAVAAMNPCHCGFLGDADRECRCSPDQIRRYRNRISGPFLDRMDLMLPVNRELLSFSLQDRAQSEKSSVVRERINVAIGFQRDRCSVPNARLGQQAVRDWCWPDRNGQALLKRAAKHFAMSLRACDRVLRVARTIADLRCSNAVVASDVAEAIALRGMEIK